MYAYFLVCYPLLSGYLQWRGSPEAWVSLGIQLVLLLSFLRFVVPRLPGRASFVDFDGDHLNFGGASGYSWWRLADVDSVIVQDRLIRIRLYRPGYMGNEFIAGAEGMSEEDWAALTELCRKIEASVKIGVSEVRRRAKESDEDSSAGCSWDEIKRSLER